jgi:serine/threonine protein kinase
MIKKVGSGAFGEIYKGKSHLELNHDFGLIGVNLKSGEEVAIKLVSYQNYKNQEI